MYCSPGTFNNSGSGGECGIPHEMRFPMPTPARDSPWYNILIKRISSYLQAIYIYIGIPSIMEALTFL